jgi:hypothetical protein|tara:strand:- start:55 stop:768 length:714 start_codon:yes stop_codon:yes gene_type:complete
MNRTLENIKNARFKSKRDHAKAIMGYYGETVAKSVLERAYQDREYNLTEKWYDSVDMTFKVNNRTYTSDVKLQTIWHLNNSVALNWKQYWRKHYDNKLPDEIIFITAPFYDESDNPITHKHSYKLFYMMIDDFKMHLHKLPKKDEGYNKRFIIKLPTDTIDNFKNYNDANYYNRDQYAYNNRRLLINEIAVLNEQEIEDLKEIQLVLHELGIKKHKSDYKFSPNSKRFYNEKRESIK